MVTRCSALPRQVVDHYENPRNVGSLDRNAKNVGTGLVGAPACGDVMKLQVRGPRGFCWHRGSMVGMLAQGERGDAARPTPAAVSLLSSAAVTQLAPVSTFRS